MAKRLGDRGVHNRGPGEWVITGEPVEEDRKLMYAIECSAWVDADVLTVRASGEVEGYVRDAYEAARNVLATTDIGTWLCDTMTKLGGDPKAVNDATPKQDNHRFRIFPNGEKQDGKRVAPSADGSPVPPPVKAKDAAPAQDAPAAAPATDTATS